MIFFGIKNRWTHLRKKHDKEKYLPENEAGIELYFENE